MNHINHLKKREREREKKNLITCLTFLVMDVDLSCGGIAMFENGTSMEYLMECSS